MPPPITITSGEVMPVESVAEHGGMLDATAVSSGGSRPEGPDPMKLGIYLNAQHPAGDDPAGRFAETVEQARLIRDLGFDSIWGGEHHVTPGFHYFPLLPLLQRLPPRAAGPGRGGRPVG